MMPYRRLIVIRRVGAVAEESLNAQPRRRGSPQVSESAAGGAARSPHCPDLSSPEYGGASMRRLLTVTTIVAALVAAFVTSASAESDTVKGAGDIKKMAAANKPSVVVAKVFGLDKPCDAQSLTVKISSRRDATWSAEAGCYQGTWITGLYKSASGDGSDAQEVDCPGFRMTYTARHHRYRVVVPRSCIKAAPDKVRVYAEGRNYTGSAVPGAAG